MFTGIVREVGQVAAVEQRAPGAAVRIACGPTVADAALGDSISVNGVCLTVTELTGDGFATELMGETLERSALRRVAAGDSVNLEPALRAGDRLDGHLVLGHVDGVGTVTGVEERDGWRLVRFAPPAELARFMARKGSVCIDGVSLTIAEVDDAGFAVGLIPHTLSSTTLGRLQAGDPVNLEVDVIARYVDRLLSAADTAHPEP